jgi:hypothetical protein
MLKTNATNQYKKPKLPTNLSTRLQTNSMISKPSAKSCKTVKESKRPAKKSLFSEILD